VIDESINETWRKFLTDLGAVFQDGAVEHFGDPRQELSATAKADVLADLSHLALIRVTGEDAEPFLHGQLSNDLKALDAGHSQLSTYCNAKGRMLALFRIIRYEDGFLLQLPAAMIESVLKRLGIFVLRAKVTLQPAGDTLVCIGLSGPKAEQALEKVSGKVPVDEETCLVDAGPIILRVPGIFPRFELIGPPSGMRSCWSDLTAYATSVGSRRWAWLDIMAGLPNIYPATAEQFVPQMVNVDLLGGISFKKGCYPGQEVVARMHYLGRLKQRMILAHLAAHPEPRPGDRLFAADLGNQASGHVVDAHPSPQGGCDLLAVVRISSYENESLHLGAPDGPPLTLLDLPYPLEEAS